MNRAFASVELGVGVRVVRGDQTGYGFTEDLTREGLLAAAPHRGRHRRRPRPRGPARASTPPPACPRATR